MVLEKELYKIERKRMKEQKMVEEMIALYCKKHHNEYRKTGHKCDECQRLCDYAVNRIKYCPFMETKSFCANCRVHCYKAEMREQIRRVMRYAGPRMIFYHPGMVVYHIVTSIKEKINNNIKAIKYLTK